MVDAPKAVTCNVCGTEGTVQPGVGGKLPLVELPIGWFQISMTNHLGRVSNKRLCGECVCLPLMVP